MLIVQCACLGDLASDRAVMLQMDCLNDDHSCAFHVRSRAASSRDRISRAPCIQSEPRQ